MPLVFLLILMYCVSPAYGVVSENIDFTEFTLLDHDNSIEIVSSNRVEWNQLDRTANRSLSTHLRESHLADFRVDFEFCVTEIHPNSTKNRVMVILYSVRSPDPEGELSEVTLYCEQVSTSKKRYRLVFLQGEYNENYFVDLSPILDVNQQYSARIERIDNEIQLIISMDVGESRSVHNSGWRECGPAKFNKIRTVWSIPYPDDSFDYCSGYIQNMELTEVSDTWLISMDRMELKGYLTLGSIVIVTVFTIIITQYKDEYV